MIEIKFKTGEVIVLPDEKQLEKLGTKVEVESISYKDVCYLKDIVCSTDELKNLNNICNEIKRKEGGDKLKNIIEIMKPYNIEDFSNILKEVEEFYIVENIPSFEEYGKYLFEKACKSESEIPSETLEYLEQTKQFVDDSVYGYIKANEQRGIIKNDIYIAYFGNEAKLKNILKNVGIPMVMPEEQKEIKLYMPLEINAFGYINSEYKELEYTVDELDYKEEITTSLEKYKREGARGLFKYYGERDSLDAKVSFWHFEIEELDGELFGIAKVMLRGKINDKEMDKLKEYITGQASDGFGEGFEQQRIKVQDGRENIDIYVSFWSASYSWKVQTAEEMEIKEEQKYDRKIELK